jgi:predicted small metal-binding protein
VEKQRALFRELDGRAPFHRDTALGRIFHPGTLSFREISANDSLHITVSPANRVSVHVDRVSPLEVRPGRSCRYSLWRAVAHNLTHVSDAVLRLCRRRLTDRRCDLECEVTRADALAHDVYEFSCRAAGAEGCGWSTLATTEDELVANVAEHVRRVHSVGSFSDTMAAYAIDVARRAH